MKNAKVFDRIQEDTKIGFDIISKNINPQEEAVLIIGNNGSGKTTLSKYLTSIKVENKIENPTLFPNKYEYKDKNLAFWDLPGFCNSVNSLQDITSSLYITKLLENYQKIKIVILVPEKSFGGKLEEFIQVVNLVGKMLDGKVSDDSFVFIINNATVEDHKELANFLESVLKDKLTQYPDFINAIIKQANNNEVVFLKSIEDLEPKSKIIQLIEKVKYIDKITNAVSSATNYKITELFEVISHDIQNIFLENYSEFFKHEYIEHDKKDRLIKEIDLVKSIKDINSFVGFLKQIPIKNIEIHAQLDKIIDDLNFLGQFNPTEVEVIVNNYKNKLLSGLYQLLDTINQKILLLNENNLKIVEKDLLQEKSKEIKEVDKIKEKDVIEKQKVETQLQVWSPELLNPLLTMSNKNLPDYEETKNNSEYNNEIVERFKKAYSNLFILDYTKPMMRYSYNYKNANTSDDKIQLIEETIKSFKTNDNKLPDICIGIIKFMEVYKNWDDTQMFCESINKELFEKDSMSREYFESLKYKFIANQKLDSLINKFNVDALKTMPLSYGYGNVYSNKTLKHPNDYELEQNIQDIIRYYDKAYQISFNGSLKNEINMSKAQAFINFGDLYKKDSLQELKSASHNNPIDSGCRKATVVLYDSDMDNVKRVKKAKEYYEKAKALTNIDQNVSQSINDISNTLDSLTKAIANFEKKEGESSCMIFSVTDIEYDNPILNYPEIIKTLTNNLSMNYFEVVDKVSGFDKDFVREVCLSGNVELLQECFEL